MKIAMPKRQPGDASLAARVSKQMVFIGPLITILFLSSLPAAIGVYWVTTSVFSIGQQALINRSLEKEEKQNDGHRTVSGKNKTTH